MSRLSASGGQSILLLSLCICGVCTEATCLNSLCNEVGAERDTVSTAPGLYGSTRTPLLGPPPVKALPVALCSSAPITTQTNQLHWGRPLSPRPHFPRARGAGEMPHPDGPSRSPILLPSSPRLPLDGGPDLSSPAAAPFSRDVWKRG